MRLHIGEDRGRVKDGRRAEIGVRLEEEGD